jgi:hypothetical protein
VDHVASAAIAITTTTGTANAVHAASDGLPAPSVERTTRFTPAMTTIPPDRFLVDIRPELSAHLDLLILRTLIFGPEHGQGIARAIQRESDNVLTSITDRSTRRSSGSRSAASSRPSGARRTTTGGRASMR